MDDNKLNQIIDRRINQKLNSMSNMANSNHAHNGYDVNQLDPADALLGFPVIQVTDATASPLVANPNDKPITGTFRFYVDTVPKFVFWAYLTYVDATGVPTSSWRYINLT